MPATIRKRVGAVNATLESGLRCRRRILFEVFGHLSPAADGYLTQCADKEQARRRAIAAFESPEQLARVSKENARG